MANKEQQQDVLDAMMDGDIMGGNPFENNDSQKTNPNVYKTHPRDSKSEDGIYRAKVRVIFNPYNPTSKGSIIKKTAWYLQGGPDGTLEINGMLDTKDNRRICPLFKASSEAFLALDGFADRYAMKAWPNDANKRAAMLAEFNAVEGRGKEAWDAKFRNTELGKLILNYAKENFDNTTSSWVLVQILEDENKPELVGRIMLMKLPKDIREKLEAKQYPSEEDKKKGKKAINLMSWVLGYPLEINVKPGDDPNPVVRDRNISYATCDFATEFEPIRKIDGTPLFDEAQMEILEEYANARKDADTAKAAKKREEAAAKIAGPVKDKDGKVIKEGTELYNKVRALTGIALDYLKNEAKVINIEDEIAYKPWDAETSEKVQRWIDFILLKNIKVDDAPAATSPAAPAAPANEAQDADAPF